MTKADWTLLAIHFARERGLSPVQLQKVLFLLGQNVRNRLGSDFYRFFAYNYGPFCKAVYEDAERHAAEGLIAISEVPGQRWSRFVISPVGNRRAQHLLSTEAPPDAADYLQRTVEWASNLSFADLVRAIYNTYPAYRANSVFQG